MTTEPDFDRAVAHKFFAADCFNKAWALIDKADRTADEDQQMIRLNQASMWHWTQREDCTDKNMSIGYWQASRIYALLGDAENARGYGQLSLEYSEQLAPFYKAYAHEALARAEGVAGNSKEVREHLQEARALAGEIDDAQDREVLEDDLKTIE
ncbi:MAG: hypothetical protein ACE5JF_03245 [Anaerolineales bacterium]